MKFGAILPLALFIVSSLSCGGEKKDVFLRENMIPAAREFIKRNGLPYDTNFGTNRVVRYTVDFFDDGRSGGQADMKLENGYRLYFDFNAEITRVWCFHDQTKTYYHLDSGPKEQVDAVMALNLRNKLNDKTALELATKFFHLQGYKEEDFHPVEFRQLMWTGGPEVSSRLLPYYRAEWYRKEVNMADRDAGNSTLSRVAIEVSGITTNMVYYSSFIHLGEGVVLTNNFH